MKCTTHRVNNCTQSACRRERDRRSTQDATADPISAYETFSSAYSDTSSGSSDCGSSSGGSSDSGSSNCGGE